MREQNDLSFSLTIVLQNTVGSVEGGGDRERKAVEEREKKGEELRKAGTKARTVNESDGKKERKWGRERKRESGR